MSAKRPVVVLQMQRMGDLILTFPLLLWLARVYPGHPLWVVAEPGFFEPLMPLSPKATYFPWSALDRLSRERAHLVLNLSHRPEAARLAGRIRSDETLGPVVLDSGARYIRGGMQLYRAGLTGANRHNRFHWADMNALDSVPAGLIAETRWPEPRRHASDRRRIGLFLGASERSKRPDAEFWAGLARELVRRGLYPVLLGGPAERELGSRVSRLTGGLPDQCGKFSLAELAAVGQSLQMLITPDTGPMHLAAWTGTRTLNLSLGPVNPWETGPYQPGHAVLRASMSCTGCWECGRDDISCRATMNPRRVALLAQTMVEKSPRHLSGLRTPGQSLFLTGRDEHGLFGLKRLTGREALARESLGHFWHAFFGHALGLWDCEAPATAFAELSGSHPTLARFLKHRIPAFGRDLRAGLTGVLPSDFWHRCPPLLRPLSSYLHLLLENGDYKEKVRRQSLGLLERLLACLENPVESSPASSRS